jgi:hypothetical protein
LLAPRTFDYALVRLVPRVERGEQLNVGAILFCKAADFLAARIALDRDRVLALAPDADLDALATALAQIPAVCRGDAGAGAIARLPQVERFHWLTSPRSTIIQPSVVHSGLCIGEPQAALDRLIEQMVMLPQHRS